MAGGGLSLPPPESENPESIPEDEALESALEPSTVAGSLPTVSDEGETNEALFGGGGILLEGSVKIKVLKKLRTLWRLLAESQTSDILLSARKWH